MDLAFESIRDGFATPNPLGLIALGLTFVGFVLFINFFRLYDVRHYIRGRSLYWWRRYRGQPVSSDRVRRNIPLVIAMPHDSTPFRTKTWNLSPHGMFVVMDPPMLPGDHFRFILNVTADRSISARAEVKWQLLKPTPLTPKGMGCKFFDLSEDDEKFLRKYLKSLKR